MLIFLKLSVDYITFTVLGHKTNDRNLSWNEKVT